MADEMLGIKITKTLLENALETKPSKKELYFLCDASQESAALCDYLRGMFKDAEVSPALREMAERLEQVLSFRLSLPTAENEHDIKLHQTVADYLMRARKVA